MNQGHGQLAIARLARLVLGVGLGQSFPSCGNAGAADLDGVPIKLPRVITVNELEL